MPELFRGEVLGRDTPKGRLGDHRMQYQRLAGQQSLLAFESRFHQLVSVRDTGDFVLRSCVRLGLQETGDQLQLDRADRVRVALRADVEVQPVRQLVRR